MDRSIPSHSAHMVDKFHFRVDVGWKRCAVVKKGQRTKADLAGFFNGGSGALPWCTLPIPNHCTHQCSFGR